MSLQKGILPIVLAGLSACVIDTVPLPEEEKTGRINESALFYTTAPVILVGSEWAVPAGWEVVVQNPQRSEWQGRTIATENGSFNMPLNANVGEQVFVRIAENGHEHDVVLLQLLPPPGGVFEATDDLSQRINGAGSSDAGAMWITVSPPDDQGLVTVVGPPETLDWGILVVIANLANGASTTATVQADGSFKGRVLGHSGDRLSIFVVEPARSNAGVEPLEVLVP